MESRSYILEMKSHSEPRGDAKDKTETDAKEQSDHGGIIVRAQIAGDEYSRPDPDIDDDSGYDGDDDTSDDNIMSPAGNIFRKSG